MTTASLMQIIENTENKVGEDAERMNRLARKMLRKRGVIAI